MITIRLYGILKKRALVTRQTARVMLETFSRMSLAQEEEIAVDFSGIEAVTPSFVDETLAVLIETLNSCKTGKITLIFLNPPTRLSSKFVAIAKARGLSIREMSNNSWAFTNAATQELV